MLSQHDLFKHATRQVPDFYVFMGVFYSILHHKNHVGRHFRDIVQFVSLFVHVSCLSLSGVNRCNNAYNTTTGYYKMFMSSSHDDPSRKCV